MPKPAPTSTPKADADPRPLQQLTRNVGRHLRGETFRGDAADMERLGFKPDDYTTLTPGAGTSSPDAG